MPLLWILLLAFVWCLLHGKLTLPYLAMGLALGVLILRLGSGPGAFRGRLAVPLRPDFPLRLAGFLAYFLKEMVAAQFRVAYDIVTPAHKSSPGIVGIPLDARTDAEITVLACLISLTPGSLSLELSPDRRVLYVHVMFIRGDGPGSVRKDIKNNLERRLLELMR